MVHVGRVALYGQVVQLGELDAEKGEDTAVFGIFDPCEVQPDRGLDIILAYVEDLLLPRMGDAVHHARKLVAQAPLVCNTVGRIVQESLQRLLLDYIASLVVCHGLYLEGEIDVGGRRRGLGP